MSSCQLARYILELVEAAVANAKRAAAIRVIDRDDESKRIGDAPFQRERIGAFCASSMFATVGRFLSLRVRDLSRYGLDLAHVKTLRNDFFREFLGVGLSDQHASMSGGKLTALNVVLHRVGQL